MLVRICVLMLAMVALLGCEGDDIEDSSGAPDADTAAVVAEDPTMTPSASPPSATALVRDASGRELGTLTLAETGAAVAVSGTLRPLPPGTHGFHIHTTGRCDPPFESAGGHWNPTNRQHGAANPQGPHLGDLPNVTVGADSSATIQATTTGGTLAGANALLDSDRAAVVVHAQPDDNRTDPSGNSGDRIACGVISGL
jgi:superoxide dismutase, Cu-Zn family